MILYQLNMKTGPTPGRNFPLDKPELVIGRELGTDIVISDADVSRKHARLLQQGEGWLLEDMASTNGSYVNGARLFVPQLLKPGDQIKLGETVELLFEAAPAAAQVTRLAAEPVLEPAAAEVWEPADEPAAVEAWEPADEPAAVKAWEPAEKPAAVEAAAPVVEPVAAAFPRPQQFPDLQMPEPAVEAMDAAEFPALETPFRDAPPPKDTSKRNLTIGLIVGGSCLLLLCVCVVLAAVGYFIIAPVAQ